MSLLASTLQEVPPWTDLDSGFRSRDEIQLRVVLAKLVHDVLAERDDHLRDHHRDGLVEV